MSKILAGVRIAFSTTAEVDMADVHRAVSGYVWCVFGAWCVVRDGGVDMEKPFLLPPLPGKQKIQIEHPRFSGCSDDGSFLASVLCVCTLSLTQTTEGGIPSSP